MPEIKLTKNQWARASEIAGNVGVLVLGSMVIPYLLNELDILMIISGLLITLGLWYISLIIARRY